MAGGGDASAIARKAFDTANNIQQVSSVDAIFKFNQAEQQEILSKKPWEKE